MTGQVVVILVGVIGAVILIGLAMQLLGGRSAAWRELASSFPAQGVAPDATRGEARIFLGEEGRVGGRSGCWWWLMPWTWFQGMQQVRYAVDDEFLHMESEGGALAPRSAMSVPWASVEMMGQAPFRMGRETRSPMGEHVAARIGGVVLLLPAVAVERELRLREAAELADDDASDGVDPRDWGQ